MKPLWYPDWSDERCVIVASGPSASTVDLSAAQGQVKAIAINKSWELIPWADILYACDSQWWEVNAGAPGFWGMRVGNTTEEALKRRINTVTIRQKDRASEDEILFDEPGTIAGGGSSGFQALNLACQFGCRDIALVGCDATLENGTHWHGDHDRGLKNPIDVTVDIWRTTMDRAGPALRARGIQVVNCSRDSAITGFPKVDFQDWLACS